jgi:hypothetical protein
MTNLAICLLTFIDIMEDTRRNLPDISKPTWTDIIAFTLMIFSLAPVFDHFWGYEIEAKITKEDEEGKELFQYIMRSITLFVMAVIAAFVIIKIVL